MNALTVLALAYLVTLVGASTLLVVAWLWATIRDRRKPGATVYYVVFVPEDDYPYRDN